MGCLGFPKRYGLLLVLLQPITTVDMQSFVILLTLLGLTSAIPRPQLFDTKGIEDSPDAVMITPSYDVVEEVGAIMKPAIAPRSRLYRRDGNCAVQPAGSGPVSSPDTAEAFMSNPVYPAMAENAPTPDGYSMVMQNGGASLSASNYMGLRTMKSYDTLGCASLCDQTTGCQAFNMYCERDPTVDPNVVSCPNPPSTTNFKCTLWGAPVSASQALNKGQWRDSFRVAITASNAYNRGSPPPAIACYNGPTALPGAINAPLNAQGQNTYLGYNFHAFSQSQGYDPSTCAADCNAQTAYNKRHPAADGSYQTCVFFNAYVISVNGTAQGLYCSKYSQVWAASYATNYGQYRGSDRYTHDIAVFRVDVLHIPVYPISVKFCGCADHSDFDNLNNLESDVKRLYGEHNEYVTNYFGPNLCFFDGRFADKHFNFNGVVYLDCGIDDCL
ncbi:MAG: hypothetical protein Q9200_002173 [Gallowayella weberi]